MENAKFKVNEGSFYPLVIQDENYMKLLAVQSHPELKWWFKDKEVSIEELVEILRKAE